MAEQHGFFAELKRRHVWRVAIAYAVGGWLIVQIATQVFPFFNIPNWGVRLVVILVVIGFPIVVILAWVYEITPGGVRRTAPAGSPQARPEHEIHQIGRKLNTVIVAVLIVAVALLGWRLLVLRHGANPQGRTPDVAQRNPGQAIPDSAAGAVSPDSTANAAASGLRVAPAVAAPGTTKPSAFNPPAASIVVLPFVNLNGDPKQAYFSDGITEELTNALGQNTGLTVIAWDTASKYARSKLTPKQIGMALNVAHVLAGSIQREGDAVRVTTELINTANGRQLWSAHYDDSFQNIFAVQDQVSAAIAGALKVKFAGLQASPTLNPQAHELYLKGLAAMERITAAETEAARADFEAALKLDPDYADAWAGLADAYNGLSEWSTLPLQEAQPKMRAAAEKALALDPHNVNALVQLGNADANDHRIAKARSEYEQALALDPSNARAHVDYGTVLPLKSAIAQTQEATMLDPKSTLAWGNLATLDQVLADWPQELAALRVMIQLSPQEIDAAFYLAFAYQQLQRGQDAVAAFDQVEPANSLDKQLVDAGRLTYQSRLKPALRAQALAALDRLRRAKLSPFAQFDLLQLYLALDETEPVLQMLPRSCAIARDACNDLAIDPLYRPLHGDPRFEKLSKQYTIMTVSTTPASASSR